MMPGQASGVLKEKIERLAEVHGVCNMAGNLDRVLETAVDLALEKRDPQKKLERRQHRQAAEARRERERDQEAEQSGSTPTQSPSDR